MRISTIQSVLLIAAGLVLRSSVVHAAGAINWDTNCGVTIGCFPACRSGCSYLVTWQDTGAAVDFTVAAIVDDTAAWMAIAFSDDYRMGDDSVVACINVNAASFTVVESSYNDGTENELLSPTSTGLSATSVSYANGVMTCSFTRARTNADSKFFDIDTQSWILQLGIGEVEQEGASYEMEHHPMIPYSSKDKIDFQSNEIVDVYKLNSPLVKLHGIMMVLGWFICSTVGIITARYSKDMLTPKTLLGTKIWFQLHRTAMIAVVVFVIIGFIPIFVEIEGYSQLTPAENVGFVSAHPVLGIISVVCVFANPIMAIFRPGGDHKYRFLFNWAHFGVGIGGHFFAVLTIFFGYYMERAMLPRSTVYVSVVYLLLVGFVVLLLELHKHKIIFGADMSKKGSKVDASNGAINMDSPKDQSSPDPTGIPFFALLLIAMVVFSLGMLLLGLIAAS